MKTIQIDILRTEIENSVGENTAYSGAKGETGDGTRFCRIATVAEDATLLSRLLADATDMLTDRLRDSVGESSYDGTRLKITLTLSDSCDCGTAAALAETLKGYLTAAVTGRWMRLADPAEAPQWEEEARTRLEALARRLSHRTPPQRRRVG